METPTSRSTSRRRWARIPGHRAPPRSLAATAVASSAGAAATPNAPIGATGSVAASAHSSMEVQNASSGQTTVNWTPTTQFSKTVTESVSSLATGDCVTATGTASKKSKTTIAARNITRDGGHLQRPVRRGRRTHLRQWRAWRRLPHGGAGGGGFFRGGGSRRSGGHVPASRAERRSSNFRKPFASIAIASGKVTAVNGSTITCLGHHPDAGEPRRSPASRVKSKKPAHEAQDPDAQDHHLELDTREHAPSRSPRPAPGGRRLRQCVRPGRRPTAR